MIENRPFDDLTGKDREEQMKLLQEMNPDFLKKIQDQEKIDRGLAMAGLNNSDTRGKANEFLSRITDTNGMNSVGIQQKAQQLAGNYGQTETFKFQDDKLNRMYNPQELGIKVDPLVNEIPDPTIMRGDKTIFKRKRGPRMFGDPTGEFSDFLS